MNQLCKVCGEPAAGFHFGAFTCEGCKSFFGRTYNNLGSISECKNNGECVINKKNRTACKACRLRKCLLVGMSKSGSRYGRRSNWFKIHCLLQEQHQTANSLATAAASLLRPSPYLPLFRAGSESDSGASSADPDDELRSASAPSSAAVAVDFFPKVSPSPASDSECWAGRRPPVNWRGLWTRAPVPEQEQPIDLSVKLGRDEEGSRVDEGGKGPLDLTLDRADVAASN